MASRPSTSPTWATSGSAQISAPPTQSQQNGWLTKVPPSAQWMNWWQNLVGQWLTFLDRSVVPYSDLATACGEMAVGEIGVVFENDDATGPAATTVSKSTGVSSTTQATAAVVSSGSFVVKAQMDNHPTKHNRSLDGAESGGTALLTFTRAHTGGGNEVSKILTDGTVVVVAYGIYVQCFDAATGASLWIFQNGASAVQDIAMNAIRVFVVGAQTDGSGDSVNNRHVHSLNKTSGGVDWSYRHSAGGTIACVTTNGRQVFISGSVSSYASGATTRALRALDGADADNEGASTAADASGLSWNKVDAHPATVQCMDCDGRFVYVGYDHTAANQFAALSPATGDLAWGYADPDGSADCMSVAVDQDFAYYCSNNAGAGSIRAIDKATGEIVWQKIETPSPIATASLCSDGQALFAIQQTSQKILRITRGNVPMRVRKSSQTTIGAVVRYKNWILQPEAQ